MTQRSGGASGHHRHSWLKPGTWHLRTRLVLVAMALLVAICAAVGVFSYASMDSFLTRQLDERLTGASDRARDFGRRPPGGLGNRPDPLDARGQAAGTLVGRIEDGQVVSAGFLPGRAPARRYRRKTARHCSALPLTGFLSTAPCPAATTGWLRTRLPTARRSSPACPLLTSRARWPPWSGPSPSCHWAASC